MTAFLIFDWSESMKPLLLRTITTITLVAIMLLQSTASAEPWQVKLQSRSETGDVKTETAKWKPAETAIVVVDMWNDHHCKSAATRVVEMAPHMNKVLKAARARGVLVVHSPSGCMDTYKDQPARKRAIGAKLAKIGTKFQWNYFNEKHEGPLAAKYEAAGCSCDTAKPCGPGRRVWTSQIKTIEIEDEDAVSDNGQEVYNLMEERGIKNVIVMGVHTNRCVLGRPFGIRQMVYVGKNVVLCRDLTDSYHRDPGKHFQGLDTIIAHIERYWCPTITSESITGEAPFFFAARAKQEPSY